MYEYLAGSFFVDRRGVLSVLDEIPFEIRRVFWITDVPEGEKRGEHAHRTLDQVIICAHGACTATVQSSEGVLHNLLLRADGAGILHVPPMYWLTLEPTMGGTVIVVLASAAYDPDDAIEEEEWTALLASPPATATPPISWKPATQSWGKVIDFIPMW